MAKTNREILTQKNCDKYNERANREHRERQERERKCNITPQSKWEQERGERIAKSFGWLD